MSDYSKILVAFDGSESSENALRQTLGGFEQSWVKVLGVVPSYDGDLEMVGIRDLESLLRGPTDDLKQRASAIIGADSSRASVEVMRGEAFEQIVGLAERESCNLIVMGRHGLHRMERMLMGSVTAKVIVHSDKDVLVVPKNAVIGWKRILLATDGSASGDAALDDALDYAGRHGSALDAISVVDMHPEYYADAGAVVDKLEKKASTVLEHVRERAGQEGVEITTQVLRGDPAAEITAFSAKGGAGITFVGSRGQSGLRKIVLGSVAQKVIGLSASPVFVVKAK
ncbi:MAG: universal stress protein [Actinobacteria bacterium]|nr:universal stress protein [Actinomycetota bacterium]MCL5882838.1 universal stress protein [Actinomycetota bacterium]